MGVPPRDLEDVAHDLFIVVHRQLAQYDETRPLRPWITGIARRVASDYRRKARHRFEVQSDREHRGHGSGAEASLERKRAVATLVKAMEKLSEDQRVVFVLHELEQRPIPEIGEALGVSTNTLYTRLRRARAHVTKRIEQLRRTPPRPDEMKRNER